MDSVINNARPLTAARLRRLMHATSSSDGVAMRSHHRLMTVDNAAVDLYTHAA